jgi:hypothetical protein
MRAELLNVPQTEADWAVWGFAHRDDHLRIRNGIQRRTGINLPEYPLDPIPLNDPGEIATWLTTNQLAHNDMNNVLNLVGASLEGVNFANPEEAAAWIYLHRKEHEAAAEVVGV